MDTLREFLESQGADIRSISELTRLSLETLAIIAVNKFGVEEQTNTSSATKNLQRLTYGKALLNNRRYGAGHLKNLQNEASEDAIQFDSGITGLPKGRGRPPKWDESDDERLRKVAKATLESPKMQKLLEDMRNGKKE